MIDGVAPVDFPVVTIKTLGVHIVAESEGGKGGIIERIEPLTGVLALGAVVEGDGDSGLGREMAAHPHISIGVLL